MNGPNIGQVERSPEGVANKEGRSTFRQVPWALKHCFVALGVIIVFRVAFYVLSLMDRNVSFYMIGGVLWISMFCWMILFPLWITRRESMLRRPIIGRVLKEFGIAIPLVFCLLFVEGLILFILQKITGEAVEVSSAFSRLRGAPNDARLYLLLIPAFTLGPIAEELFFRGFLYNAFRQWIAPLRAFILQAFFFALLHYDFPEGNIAYSLYVFVTGLVMAGVYEWRKTLWSPIAFHIMINFIFVGSVIALMILNSHTPAKTWQEAELPPEWLETDLSGIERMATGEEQRLHAINTYGSRGMRMWKKELQCFQAVCRWFPEDREACARARIGIAQIYQSYLRDFRRAVVESDRILSQFKDRPEDCAEALIIRGWSYYELNDYEKSRASFHEVIESYTSYGWAWEAALIGLKTLDDG